MVSQADADCPCCPLLSLSGQGINWIMGSAALERERYCTNAFYLDDFSRHSFLIAESPKRQAMFMFKAYVQI